MNETWKDIEGYEGYYQVSTLSRVRSLNRTVKRMFRGTLALHPIKGQILRQTIGKIGYPTVELNKEGKAKRVLVHRLIAKAFLPNPSGKPQINHKDSNRANNELENLEWCTQSENIRHCFNNNRHPGSGLKGIQMYTAKLNELQVRIIKRCKGEIPGPLIGNIFGVSHTIIYGIWNKKIWTHIK